MRVPDTLRTELAAAGFFQRAREVEFVGNELGWVVRGTTDRRWTYAGGDALGLFRADDTHFAAIAPELAERITQRRHVLWKREARTFSLPAANALEPGTYAASPLSPADSATIDQWWEHHDEVSLAYVEGCLQRDPAFGVRLEGRLVGWELVHDDGALGAAFVLPEFRRRGVMKTLQYAMVEAMRARGLPLFKHIALDNREWLGAQERLGWNPVRAATWLEVSP